MPGPRVEARGIVKRYPGTLALRGASLTAEPGRLTIVAGPSGSGKTTLLRIIGGFEEPDEGRILFDDRDVTGDPPWERGAMILSQRPVLLPHLTVEGNLLLALEARGYRGSEARARAREIAGLLGIEGVLARRPGELSGGQLQRASLAAVLAAGPRVVLLDEPFAHLDLPLRESLRVLVQRLARETGSTFIQVTHDQDEALEAADSLAILVEGRVVEQGRPDRIYSSPGTPEAAVFLGHNLACKPPLSPGEGVAATFPPERVEILPRGPWLVSRVARRRGYWLVELALDGSRVRAYLPGSREPPRLGGRVGVRVEDVRVWGPGLCGALRRIAPA